MNDIAETHLFQACTIERDRGTQQGACVALPEVSTVVAAPPAHAARAGAAARMWQIISACTPPLRPVGRAGRTKARVHVGSAHRGPKGTAAKMRARELMRARSGEKRTPDTGDFRSARLGARTTETQAANSVANGFAFTLP